LQHLLDPDYEPFAKTTKLPPLPAYGHDSSRSYYNGLFPERWRQTGFAGLVVRDAVYHPQAQILRFGATSAEFEQAQFSSPSEMPIAANAPHSMASDAWKGLVFSLMAGNRNQEALASLGKIPPDVRRQLEADIEFVQGVASLYVAVGDAAMAREYLTRVENYYLLHRLSAPAGLEVQHAWLLYNLKDDIALYPLMVRLDARQDLNADQRTQLDSLWATWAVRRAETAMDEGNMPRGVAMLQAASRDYPDNLDVRRAVAGAYARVGRAADAVTLFKTIPMDNATSGDYQGAISAALGATDMVQAEAWLRQALARFPNDPKVLGLAARFEQARGNNERAADYWRAALATMPPDSAVKSLDSGLGYPAGSIVPPAPGDTKRLLDPRHEPMANSVPPLPAYPTSAPNHAPVSLTGPPAESAPQHQWLNTPSNDPLPMPAGPGASIVPLPNSQGAAPGNAPVFTPRNAQEGTSIAQPVLIQQSWTHPLAMWPTVSATHKRKKAHKAHATHSARRVLGPQPQLPPPIEMRASCICRHPNRPSLPPSLSLRRGDCGSPLRPWARSQPRSTPGLRKRPTAN
jgi:tetratricopeptide (TPR) repeat protein